MSLIKTTAMGMMLLSGCLARAGAAETVQVNSADSKALRSADKGERITVRSSPQKDFPTADQVVDGKFIVVGDREPKAAVYRDVRNTYQGQPVYRFEASEDANRIEFCTCFASPSVALSSEQKEELSELGEAYAVCDMGRYGDTITYDWYARFPEPFTKESHGIFAQWHGRSDATLVQTPSGEMKKLTPKERLKLLKTMSFKHAEGGIGIDLKTGQPNGWRCDGASGAPIGSLHILEGRMCFQACNDPAALSDSTVRVKAMRPGQETARKGNKTAAMAFSTPLSEVPINQWIHFTVQIKFSSYSQDSDKALTPGFVKVWMDGKQLADWHGDIGKNDELGPYFKYGIYKPGPGGFKVDCAGFSQVIEPKH
ncbi:MAG TPA: heparin lyase I family protein [Pontiellaceae bacterium]|nr:heparin lyase I family protein [Pontiellaceae bacterium]